MKDLVIVHRDAGVRHQVTTWAEVLGWRVYSTDGRTAPTMPPDSTIVLVLLDAYLDVNPEGWLFRYEDINPRPSRIVLMLASGISDLPSNLRQLGRRDEVSILDASYERVQDLLQSWSSSSSSDESMYSDLEASKPALQRAPADPDGPKRPTVAVEQPTTRALRASPMRLEAMARWFSHLPDDRLAYVAYTLLNMCGVTRMRLYHVEPLYEHHATAEQRWVLRPLFEHGGGFNRGVDWRDDEFVLPSEVFADLFEWGPKPVILGVDDDDKRTSLGCRAIAWGNATSRGMIPLVVEDRRPIGLLAIDRRSDLPGSRPDHAKRWGTAITNDDIGAIMDALPGLTTYLARDVVERCAKGEYQWEQELTTIISGSVAATRASEGLEAALGSIATHWEHRERRPLRDLYVVREHNDGQLQAWVGVGPLFEHRKRNVRQFYPTSPYDEAREHPAVIQDMRIWCQSRSAAQLSQLRTIFGANLEGFTGLGSWLAIPLRQGERGRGVLVVGATRANYFTASRVRTLVETSARLTPLYLWDLAEAQRDWAAAALEHQFVPSMAQVEDLLCDLPAKTRDPLKHLFDFQRCIASNLHYVWSRRLTDDDDTSTTELLQALISVIDLVSVRHRRSIHATLTSGPIFVGAPPSVVQMVLFNVIQNAARYCRSDGHPSVSVVATGGMAVVEVRNPVVAPILPNEVKRIFLLFERGSQPSSAVGTGLGLAVASELAQLVQGNVELVARGEGPDETVVFRIVLPLVTSPAQAEEVIAHTPPVGEVERKEATYPTAAAPVFTEADVGGGDSVIVAPTPPDTNSGVRLFFVDDEDYYLTQVRVTLAQRSSHVALQAIIDDRPVGRFMRTYDVGRTDDWFLLDISMPEDRELEHALNVWPERHGGNYQICGLALAKWLVAYRGIDPHRIALVTKWAQRRHFHSDKLRELGLTLGTDGIAYISNTNVHQLSDWLSLIGR